MKHSFLVRVALLLLSVAATLCLLEGAFRLLGIRAEFHQPRRDELLLPPGLTLQKMSFGLYSYGIIRSVYDSNPRGYFDRDNGIDQALNAVGWRDVDHPLPKPPGSYRILGLGDSYLWGQGVRREDICLTKLGDILNATGPGLAIEIINAAVGGINTSDERDLLQARGMLYNPDLVIVHFVLNDVEERLWRKGPKIEFFSDYTAIFQTPDRLSEVSRLWGWARQRWLARISAQAYIEKCVASFKDESESWRNCRAALSDIKSICDRNGVSLLVVIFPFFHDLNQDYPFRVVHDAVRTYCERNDIPVLDLLNDFRGFRGPELWVHPTDQHPNEIAHNVAAKSIARWLIEHRTLQERPGKAPLGPSSQP